MSNKNQKDALILAGKLAEATQIFLRSKVEDFPVMLDNLKAALFEYNKYIFEWATEKE